MNKEIKIGKTSISCNSKPYFIADIAANHDGDINRAYKLIELAKEAGADVAKFQNFKANKIVSDIGFREMGSQVAHQKNWGKSVYEVYEDASVNDEWTPLLKKKCDEIGIEYMTSPYDFEAVDLADKFVNAFKIGSGDITWHEMLEYIAKKNKPVFIATGAVSLKEVEIAVEKVLQINNKIVLMQCNTNYTANKENFKYINLNVINTYKRVFPDLILGLSDHTLGPTTVLGAIALGARVIEKHFTDDTTRIGPDHKFSVSPPEWREMVNMANDLWLSLGNGEKIVEGNEIQTSIVQRRGLYLTKELTKGTTILKDDLEPLRPRSSDGFEPYEIALLIGKKVNKNLKSGAMLKRGDVYND